MQVEMQEMQEMSTKGKWGKWGKGNWIKEVNEAKTPSNFKMLQCHNVKNINKLHQMFLKFYKSNVRVLAKSDSVINANFAPC